MLADVLAEDPRRALRRRIEAEQRVQQRGLARSVRTEQANAASLKLSLELLQNGTRTKANLQAIEFDHRGHGVFYGVTPC